MEQGDLLGVIASVQVAADGAVWGFYRCGGGPGWFAAGGSGFRVARDLSGMDLSHLAITLLLYHPFPPPSLFLPPSFDPLLGVEWTEMASLSMQSPSSFTTPSLPPLSFSLLPSTLS